MGVGKQFTLGSASDFLSSDDVKENKSTVDSQSDSTFNRDSSTTGQQASVSQQDRTQNETTSASTKQNTQTLSDADLAALRGGLQKAAGLDFTDATKTGATDLVSMARDLTTRAAGTTDFFNQNLGAILAGVQKKFDTETLRDINTAAAQYGSKDNSFAALTLNQGRQQLGTDLASVAAQTLLQGRTLESSDLATAFNAASGANKNLQSIDLGSVEALKTAAVLGDTIKGGQTSATATSTVDRSLLDSLIGATQSTVQQDTSETGTSHTVGNQTSDSTFNDNTNFLDIWNSFTGGKGIGAFSAGA